MRRNQASSEVLSVVKQLVCNLSHNGQDRLLRPKIFLPGRKEPNLPLGNYGCVRRGHLGGSWKLDFEMKRQERGRG